MEPLTRNTISSGYVIMHKLVTVVTDTSSILYNEAELWIGVSALNMMSVELFGIITNNAYSPGEENNGEPPDPI